MLRCAITALRTVPLRLTSQDVRNAAKIISQDVRSYTAINATRNVFPANAIACNNLLKDRHILVIANNINPVPVRKVTKFSLKRGKRKTVKAVVKRFFRLHWGGWIRTRVGRHKKLWRKSAPNKRRLREHVFCNATQNTLLDKMVTKFWKKPKYYVEDPYAPYHTREEFLFTRKKPVPKC